MKQERILEILKDIKKIKKELGFEIIDSHVHPYDVLGVADNKKEVKKSFKNEDFLKPSILEFLEYNKVERFILTLGFFITPKYVHSIIRKKYVGSNKERILKEMDISLIDKSSLLPIEPWISSEAIGKNFQHQRFFVLGSIDVCRIKLDKIEKKIKELIKNYKIVGIKLHPNLQNFKPQPSHNSLEIAKKLRKIYSTIEKEKLYLVFHGGYSDYSNINDPEYKRSRDNALLKSFCDYKGKSELFNNYDIPIVIAHLGHNAILRPDYRLIKSIIQKFNNVYFDTSGASPTIIKKVFKIAPSKRIIFGSDALYNNMTHNLVFLYQGLKSAKIKEGFKDSLANVLGENYKKRILKI